MAIGLVCGIMALGRLLACLETTSVGIEVGGGVIILVSHRLCLLRGGGLWVLVHLLFVREPVVISSVRSVAIVWAVELGVVALPPICRIFRVVLIILQAILVLASEFLFLD